MQAGVQLLEHRLGSIKQARLQVVLPQFKHCGKSLLPRQVAAFEQVAMHADRTFGFPAPPKQASQREMQLYCLRIKLDHLDERINSLVRLLIEQKIQASKIRLGQ